ncbi:MAG: porin family protein [Qipengyuania sp.]|jgi:outer membrane immunogenic protein|nr:porin family protein [Qipengyuania sp.]
MKMTTALLAAASLVAIATPVAAQDEAPFSGLRVGAEAGYDMLRSGSSATTDTTRNLDQSIDGVNYAAVVGYDAAVGEKLRIGAEASFGDSTAKWRDSSPRPTVFNLGRVEAQREIYVGGRVGYVTSPDLMFYAKAGYTNQRFGLEGSDGTASASQRLDTDGYRLGAGAEYAFSGNVYGGLEYRYSNYRKGEFDFNGTTPDSSRFDIDTDRHQVVATVGVRF